MFVFILLGGLIYLSPSEVMAQEVITNTVDAKTQSKVEKAKVKLKNYQEHHVKAVEKSRNLRANFEKKNSAGKLSPNAVEKMTKKMEKQSKSIEKLEKKMDKLKKYIEKNS
ncbi:hypothetical protein C8N25_1069 [Algoriphagus antarcticus]|uniref:Uncharacterized protein n=2 Tax=Algoriphagus antarcticus TaxID=238540 RepID=A0A3E0DX16_9BACT|nr:hypothetical protein C8N25_1069 [Algoriphagus antarcticus]